MNSECTKKIKELKKHELQWMFTHYCKHRMPYSQHPNCYFKEKLSELKIGYLDIESGGLFANFDYLLTYCIKVRGEKTFYEGIVKRDELLSGELDKPLLKKFIDDMKKFDVVITYYGTRFDIPFLRTRAMAHNLIFPGFGEIQHKDVYYMVRNRMCLHKKSLENACAILSIRGKNHIKGNYWMMAVLGDEIALKYVMDHNRKDCVILEKLHNKIDRYVRPGTRSI